MQASVSFPCTKLPPPPSLLVTGRMLPCRWWLHQQRRWAWVQSNPHDRPRRVISPGDVRELRIISGGGSWVIASWSGNSVDLEDRAVDVPMDLRWDLFWLLPAVPRGMHLFASATWTAARPKPPAPTPQSHRLHSHSRYVHQARGAPRWYSLILILMAEVILIDVDLD